MMATKRTLTPARAVAAAARAILAAVPPGGSATVILAEGAFWRRESYRAVSGAAHGLWGPGAYRLRASADGTQVNVMRNVAAVAEGLA